MSNSDDTITFDDKTEFDNFISEFTTITDTGGNDTLSFGSTAVSGDLDFSKLEEFENLNLSSGNDSLTISSDEPENINALDGDDSFTLDFSNIDNFTLDGAAGSDSIILTGTSNAISADENFGHGNSFNNIETLDFTNFDMDTSSGAEFELTGVLITQWTDSNYSLKLTLDSDDASRLEFTDVGPDGIAGNGNDTKYGGDDADATAMANGTYTLRDTVNDVDVTLTIDGL
jgi:hypothetical protein